MKITSILKNTEIGQAVPSFIGTVVSVSPVKTIAAKGDNPEYKTQSVVFSDSEKSTLRILLKDIPEEKFIHDDSVGQVYEFICKKAHNGALSGVILKEGTKDKFLCVTRNATVARVADLEVSATEETPPPEKFDKELKPEIQSTENQLGGESDKEIKKYTRERIYIYDMVVALIGQSGSAFPIEKAPEIATSIHIDLSRSNSTILPRTAPAKLFVKSPSERAKPEAQEIPSFPWRNSRNPKTGQKLGDLSKEEAVDQYLTLYYRERKRVESEGEIERVKFFKSIGLMLEEYGMKILDAVARYIWQYIKAIYEKEKIKDKVTPLLAKQKLTAYLNYSGVKNEEVTPEYLEELIRDKIAIEAIAKFDETKNKRKS